MSRVFCYLCATRLDQKSNTTWWCPSCKYTQYENPKLGVELILSHQGSVLACERGRDPYKGTFDMPGGFVEIDETAEQAIYREIEEELLLPPSGYSKPEYFTSFTVKYPYGKEVYSVITIVFIARLLIEPNLLRSQDDVASLKWITLDQVPSTNWSSDIHENNAISSLDYIAN